MLFRKVLLTSVLAASLLPISIGGEAQAAESVTTPNAIVADLLKRSKIQTCLQQER